MKVLCFSMQEEVVIEHTNTKYHMLLNYDQHVDCRVT
jgi:hypothetical protein